MNSKNFAFKALLLLFVSVFFLVSCDKDPAVAPCLTFDGKANCTIDSLVNSIGLSDSLPDVIITGVVVSTDENGAFYKQLVIQDETGGIQIKVANTSLHSRYKIGQQVFVKCKGLALGTYYSNPMIGIGTSSSVEAIPSSKECNYIFRHEMPQAEPEAFVITSLTTAAELTAHLNMLVEIPNCSFDAPGEPFVDPNGATPYTSRTVKCGNSNTLAVNTSKYVNASIANTTVPTGTGTLRGVLTLYKGSYGSGTYQIVLRSIQDVKFTWYADQYRLDEHYGETNLGWTFVNSGANWTVQGSTVKNFVIKPTGTTEVDSWAISPAIDLSGNTSAVVAFDKFYTSFNNDVCDLYYTTTAYDGGAVNAANWTKVTGDVYPGSNYVSYELPIPVTAKAIAFRYKGTSADAAMACIQKVIVKTEKRY